jgi:REP-associated tyrosine transposase
MAPTGIIPRLGGCNYRGLHTYFVTYCVKDRRHIFSDPALANIVKSTLLRYRAAGWYWLLAYCIMPDHIHQLLRLRTMDRALSRVVATLKNQISYEARSHGRTVLWQWGFHDRVLRPAEDVGKYAAYVVANPVRAGIVKDSGEYRFCGIVDRWF